MKFDAQTLLWIALLLPSITLHEFMHGWAAYKMGDPTAYAARARRVDVYGDGLAAQRIVGVLLEGRMRTAPFGG